MLPYGSITRGQLGESFVGHGAMAPMAAFSDDGRGVQSEAQMRLAMETAKGLHKLIVAHCDNSLLHGGYIHDGLTPAPTATGASAPKARGADPAGSGTGAPDRLRLPRLPHLHQGECSPDPPGQGRGAGRHLRDGPHYLLMDETMLQEGRPLQDESPSPQSRRSGEACWRGWPTGTIDMVATDHAPKRRGEVPRAGEERHGHRGAGDPPSPCWPLSGKAGPALLSPSDGAAPRCSLPPLRPPAGEDGPHADFTVFDLSASYPIDPADFLSQGEGHPFTGWPVQARCLLTVCDGRPVWQDGELFSKEDRT